MLEGLDAIDWGSLSHAYGAASDVPEMLRNVASEDADTRSNALSQAYGNIWHQGTVYEATAYAIPFLVELARSPAQNDRHEIMDLLFDLAHGSSYIDAHSSIAFVHEQHTNDPAYEENLQRELGWVRAASDAVAAALPTWIDLLEDADARVRRHGSRLLTCCRSEAARASRALGEAVTREEDPLTRAGLRWAGATLDPVGWQPRLVEALHGPAPIERLIAALALCLFIDETPSPAAIDVLLSAISSSEAYREYSEFPFGRDLVADIGSALVRVPADDRERVAGLMLEQARAGKANLFSVAEPMLCLAFPERATEVTPMQRAVVEFVASHTWKRTADGTWRLFLNFRDLLQQFGVAELGARLVGYDRSV